jgi:hypothetical protein
MSARLVDNIMSHDRCWKPAWAWTGTDRTPIIPSAVNTEHQRVKFVCLPAAAPYLCLIIAAKSVPSPPRSNLLQCPNGSVSGGGPAARGAVCDLRLGTPQAESATACTLTAS